LDVIETASMVELDDVIDGACLRRWVPCREVPVKVLKTQPQRPHWKSTTGARRQRWIPRALPFSAARAGQTVGVEQFDEFGPFSVAHRQFVVVVSTRAL
jgi:hypothetical protein